MRVEQISCHNGSTLAVLCRAELRRGGDSAAGANLTWLHVDRLGLAMSRDDQSDERVFSRWMAGDPRAGAILYEMYSAPLARFFRGRTRLPVDELVQETFYALVISKRHFRGESRPGTYVFAIAQRVLYAAQRSSRAEPADFRELEALAALHIDMRLDRSLDLVQALGALDLELREVVRDFYWDGLCTREISSRLDVPEGTVSSRLRRAREQLRARFVEEDEA